MGTTQAAVSRLEDPSYGKLSIKTLLHLSQVFDAGLEVRLVSLVDMLARTWKPSREAMRVPAFEDDAPKVGFHAAAASGQTDASRITMLTPRLGESTMVWATGTHTTVYDIRSVA